MHRNTILYKTLFQGSPYEYFKKSQFPLFKKFFKKVELHNIDKIFLKIVDDKNYASINFRSYVKKIKYSKPGFSALHLGTEKYYSSYYGWTFPLVNLALNNT